MGGDILLVIYDTSSIREPPKVSKSVLKIMAKHFIDPKRSEILSVFPCMSQIALFWPKLLPALFLKKTRYPGPFEILAEALPL
jgi:hypothetical protein